MAIQGPVGKENLVNLKLSLNVLVMTQKLLFRTSVFAYKASHSFSMALTMLFLAPDMELLQVQAATDWCSSDL